MLAAGTTLGPYKIFALLRAGGMGEVDRARDTLPGRDVAITVIPAAVHDVAGKSRIRAACRLASADTRPRPRSSVAHMAEVGLTLRGPRRRRAPLSQDLGEADNRWSR